MTTRAVPVQLKLGGVPPTAATATVEEWDQLSRVRRAVIALAICWALGGVLIFTFIPIVHLVASALLFIAGPVVAISRFLEAATLRRVEGQCPRCQAPGKFLAGGKFKSPKNVPCDGCGNLLEMRISAVQ